MNTEKFTPKLKFGGWTIDNNGQPMKWYHSDKDDTAIEMNAELKTSDGRFMITVHYPEDATFEEVENMKTKMLAAPDMYEALKKVYEKYGTMGKDWDDVKAALNKANPTTLKP